jgi:hypothetical protein
MDLLGIIWVNTVQKIKFAGISFSTPLQNSHYLAFRLRVFISKFKGSSPKQQKPLSAGEDKKNVAYSFPWSCSLIQHLTPVIYCWTVPEI